MLREVHTRTIGHPSYRLAQASGLREKVDYKTRDGLRTLVKR
jgi:hypothetical protein